MNPIREQIDIAAPAQQVWEVVHREIERVPEWSENLLEAEVVGGGPLQAGSRLRYLVKLPAGRRVELRLDVLVYEEFRRCSGTLEGGPARGTWGWTYRSRGTITTVTYETAVTLGGMFRFAGALVDGTVTGDVRRNLAGLKRYVESGGGSG